jgi:hypothetical protein
MNPKKKAHRPQFIRGRIKRKIADAKGGNADVGRELLSMAARQLQEFGKLEPELAAYIGEALDAIARDTTADIGKYLWIYEPPKDTPSKARLAHRPANEDRNRRIVTAFELAMESPLLYPTTQRDLEKLAAEAVEAIATDSAAEALKKWQDWWEDYQHAIVDFHVDTKTDIPRKKSIREPALQLAAQLFNRRLKKKIQARGSCLSKRATPDTVRGALNRSKATKRTA